MQNVDVKTLLDNAVHFGHRTQKWNPKMRSYIFGERGGIHIFDLAQTRKKLVSLLDHLKKAASEGKSILFVSTKPQTLEIITDLAQSTGNPYVSYRWINGTITNFSTIKKRVTHLHNLKSDAASGGFERYTKKEASKFRKDMTKLEQDLGGIANMTKLPDVLFVVDAHRDKNAIMEARKKKIPVYGLADTNVDPYLLDVFVPANDDAMKSLKLLLGLVKDAILEGKKGVAPKPVVSSKQ